MLQPSPDTAELHTGTMVKLVDVQHPPVPNFLTLVIECHRRVIDYHRRTRCSLLRGQLYKQLKVVSLWKVRLRDRLADTTTLSVPDALSILMHFAFFPKRKGLFQKKQSNMHNSHLYIYIHTISYAASTQLIYTLYTCTCKLGGPPFTLCAAFPEAASSLFHLQVVSPRSPNAQWLNDTDAAPTHPSFPEPPWGGCRLPD